MLSIEVGYWTLTDYVNDQTSISKRFNNVCQISCIIKQHDATRAHAKSFIIGSSAGDILSTKTSSGRNVGNVLQIAIAIVIYIMQLLLDILSLIGMMNFKNTYYHK